MLDFHTTEKLIPLKDAGTLSQPGVSHMTAWRWMKVGVKGHRLEALRIGGRWFTSREAVERFVKAVNQE